MTNNTLRPPTDADVCSPYAYASLCLEAVRSILENTAPYTCPDTEDERAVRVNRIQEFAKMPREGRCLTEEDLTEEDLTEEDQKHIYTLILKLCQIGGKTPEQTRVLYAAVVLHQFIRVIRTDICTPCLGLMYRAACLGLDQECATTPGEVLMTSVIQDTQSRSQVAKAYNIRDAARWVVKYVEENEDNPGVQYTGRMWDLLAELRSALNS